ncbi:MAG: hypothetical protein OEN02_01430 [Gammaproteobacteria bacterium]|nr:hypothetical protein [Gammaproteobacteria bacterium]MDH3536491.1 hypothetical protein [Gammaproteobacteria bacterium]
MITRCLLLALLTLLLFPRLGTSGDLPQSGYSLFDRIFSKPAGKGYVHDVPYPFEDLLQRIEHRLPGYAPDTGSPLVKVLIPRGRSLQREAARPRYYEFPRIVVALDQDSKTPALVKNRLFLGYQEKSQSIEVISYNEAAGRFDFQIVEDYAAGKTPRVRYANRSLCTSCHQNAATIFARPRWRESNFNNQVAERIAAYHKSYHGIEVWADKGDAARFDFATDQAGLLEAYQRVWQNGCDASADENRNRACRAGLFLAVLQQAIAAIPRPKYRSALIEQTLLPLLQQSWQRRWPDGMPVPSADIDDREPPTEADPDPLNPLQDPLNLRPLLANWSYKPALRRSIQGIGEQFLLYQDLVYLNKLLVQQIGEGRVPRQTLRGSCSLEFRHAATQIEWTYVDCSFVNAGDTRITVEGEISKPDGSTEPGQGKLLITGTAGWARVQAFASLDKTDKDRLRLDLRNTNRRLAARLWDNRIITDFAIELPVSPPQPGAPLDASLELSDDLGAVEAAIESMLADAANGQHDLFDRNPIQGARLMQALLKKLGDERAYADLLPMPHGLPQVAQRELAALAGAEHDPASAGSALQVMYRFCAGCHSGNAPVPPGFLHGDSATIEARLHQCAPRIARRLSMWQRDAYQWQKSPMPPPASLTMNQVDPEWWRNSEALRKLQDYIRGLLPAASAAVLETQNYEQLPQCYDG